MYCKYCEMTHVGVLLVLFVYIVIVLTGVRCTKDLNIHELQYVADHLTAEGCRQLVASLHTNSYEINKDDLNGVGKDLTCIELLVKWDEADSKNQTFHTLTHRLRQLGHKKVADKIATTVYHEKSDLLKRLFLDDPFKKMIHKNSPLLDKKPNKKQKVKKPDEDGDGPFDSYITAFIITGGICAGIISLMILKRCCVGVCAIVAPAICPAKVIDYCESVWNKVTECCKIFGKNTKKHLLGVGISKR